MQLYPPLGGGGLALTHRRTPSLHADGNRVYAGGANLYEEGGIFYLTGEGKKVFSDCSGCLNQYSTTDFMTWKFEGCVLNNSDVVAPGADKPAYYRMERPKVLNCPATGQYVMWRVGSGGWLHVKVASSQRRCLLLHPTAQVSLRHAVLWFAVRGRAHGARRYGALHVCRAVLSTRRRKELRCACVGPTRHAYTHNPLHADDHRPPCRWVRS